MKEITQQQLNDALDRTEVVYAEDVARLSGIIKDRFGLRVSPPEAIEIWERVSMEIFAGWLTMDSFTDDELAEQFVAYVTELSTRPAP